MILFVYLEYKSNKCETKTFLCNAYFLPKNLVGTNKGQSGPIRDSWCFLKKISVPYCLAVLYLEKSFFFSEKGRLEGTMGKLRDFTSEKGCLEGTSENFLKT